MPGPPRAGGARGSAGARCCGQAWLAQDGNSLAGKILRMTPADFRGRGGAEVHSLGHRNPQGLAWEPAGDRRLLASEHGPSSNDEVNAIESGANYGWPELEGPDHGPYTAPLRVYSDFTLAPSGMTVVTREESDWSGDVLLAGLRGEQLRRLSIDRAEVSSEETLLEGEFGRLRTVTEGPDGALYVLTEQPRWSRIAGGRR